MRENGCSGKLCPMQVGSVDNCKLTKEQCPYFTQDVDYQAILQVIRSELAREIFEEIEELNVPLSDVADVLVKIPAVDMTKVLSDFKKEIHDKAVYPNCHGVEPYISLKVFDAIINNKMEEFRNEK